MTATVAAPAAAAPAATSATPAPTNGAESTPQTPTQGAPSQTKPPAKAETTPTEQPWKVKRKIKLGGKEIEKEYTDRELQILEHERSQRAEFLKQQEAFNARLQKLNENPDELFQEAGFDVEAYLEQRAARKAQLAKLTPEQQEVLRLKEQLAKFETERTQAAEKAKIEAEQREHQEFVQQNVQRLGKAIELSGLPRSGELVRLYAEVQEMAAHAGEPEMSPEQLVQAGEKLMTKRLATLLKAASNEGWRARNGETLQALAKAILPALDGKALLDWVGDDFVKRIVKASWAQTRTSPVPIVQEPPPSTTSQTPPPQNGQSRSEWDILDSLGG